MLCPAYPIVTDRLELRPIVAADAVAMHAYQSREDVCRYIPYGPRTLDELTKRLASTEHTRSSLDQPGQSIVLAVVRRDNDELSGDELSGDELSGDELSGDEPIGDEPSGDEPIGDVMLAWTNREHRSGEIGYVFNPDHYGNGYATEAANALLWLGFEQLGLHRIIARIDARNDASGRVLRRLGMRMEAHLVENEWFKGEWTDELDFAILASEWRAGTGAVKQPESG